MQQRQITVIFVSLVVLIFIALAAWLIVSRDDGSGDATTTTTLATTTTTETETGLGGTDRSATAIDLPDTTTTTVTTTTVPLSVPINVPVVCTADASGAQTVADAAEDATPRLTRDSTISTVGLGAVTFGLTVPQAVTASGSAMLACEPISECYRVTPASAPPGISFLVHASTIERVDIVDGPVKTLSGYGVGSTDEQLVAAFGDKLERQVVDADTVELIFVPTDVGDADFRVVFTVEGGVVTTYRSGRLPMILQDDPCA